MIIKFLTSDNAILAFSMVHWISEFDHTWAWMRETSLSKKKGFVDKKMDEKSRFFELSTEEIQEIVHNAVPVRTKKSHKGQDELFNGTYQLSFL